MRKKNFKFGINFMVDKNKKLTVVSDNHNIETVNNQLNLNTESRSNGKKNRE